jgi:hypothetical protein
VRFGGRRRRGRGGEGRGGAATPSTSKTLLHSEEASDSLGLTVLYYPKWNEMVGWSDIQPKWATRADNNKLKREEKIRCSTNLNLN